MAVEKNNEVVVEHEFATSVEKVFEALKAGRLLYNCGAWPTGTGVDFRVGGKFSMGCGHYGAVYGEFTEIVENRKVAFTWNFDEMQVKSWVTIELSPQGARCKAKLRHGGFADRETAESHEGGWTEGLAGLSDELTKHRVRFDREFLVPVEMLYQACSGMAFFSQFGATEQKSKIDFRVGGRYECKLDEDMAISGQFLEIVKNKKIVFTWESAPCGAPIEKPTTVKMEFGPQEDPKHSYLELVHEGFTNSEATLAHHKGWNRILESIYEKGGK